MSKNDIKKVCLMVLIVILSITFLIIFGYFLFKGNNDGDRPEYKNLIDSNIEVNNTKDDEDLENKEFNEKKLKRTTQTYDYFITDRCLEGFYADDGYDDGELDTIEEEVINKLNLKTNNFIDIKNNGYCIDEIYKQELSENESIYVVYYRIGIESNKSKHVVTWIRVNEKNKAYSIYPYEYLNENNLTNLKEDDLIKIENSNEVERKQRNIYRNEDVEINNEAYVQKLFSRYKFDLLMDREHLYNSLNKEYMETKFQNFENFNNYIEENKVQLFTDIIKEYGTSQYDTYTEYKGIGRSGHSYIFDVINIMDYTLKLDDYTIVKEEILETYNTSLPNVQAKFCVDRIMNAINDKDYDFVYDKLDSVPKSNYYSNKEDFYNYIKLHFWEENEYEIMQTYMISQNIFQFIVKIKDKRGSLGYRLVTYTITLKYDDDFEVAMKVE